MTYNEYANDAVEFIYTARLNIDINKFNYRKYFKDDFYKDIPIINGLMDISRNSNSDVVIMRMTMLLNLIEDQDPILKIENHFPK